MRSSSKLRPSIAGNAADFLDTPTAPDTVSPTRAELIRAGLSATVGNWFELFDFVIYGYFAGQIGETVFPSKDSVVTLLSAFATYGVGYITRPLGSMVLGSIGDRHGRKAALVFTLLTMAGATGVTGLIPSYDSVGVAAPIMLVICRLLQGFATGGEWGGATTFLVEYAPAHRRGVFGSLQQITGNIAIVTAVATALILNDVLTPGQLTEWGWRIPFLFGVLLAPLGFYLRSRVLDTPKFRAAAGHRPRYPLRDALSIHRLEVLTIFGMVIIWTVAGSTFSAFLVSFSTKMLGVTPAWAYSATLVGAIANIVTCGISGYLSDRYGRKPFLIASAAGFMVCALPLFAIMASLRSGASVVFVAGVAGSLSGLFSGVAPTFLCELLPTRVRYTALSVGYNAAVMVFGGFAPLICIMLIQHTGLLIAPAFYVTACAAISLTVILSLRTRRPQLE
jgi:MFS transporter, MHS family, proline/betaine transporter